MLREFGGSGATDVFQKDLNQNILHYDQKTKEIYSK